MKKTIVTIISLIFTVGSIAFAEGENVKNCPFTISTGLTDNTTGNYPTYGTGGSGQGLGSGRAAKVGR